MSTNPGSFLNATSNSLCQIKPLGLRVTSKSIAGMSIFFQAIHPVEYRRPIPQGMAEEIIQQGGLGNLLCILFTDDICIPKAHGLRKQAVPP